MGFYWRNYNPTNASIAIYQKIKYSLKILYFTSFMSSVFENKEHLGRKYAILSHSYNSLSINEL